ncbi:integral peroxisomal membrane peroxin-domain-containing protein [Neohortaea acidophila]|uniref:Integral peroxisomal membrane peroxin-domain-containing protein n=1 Tax=Neohortaea acidophila TaxID=245834 RepID=A0A6A6PXQ4_9PEZI|nr:integral peroxisomal membrane peroxin-domain-containing protein [Neohortaea acidophila]KAF2484027.1 integral peroxisomal membrane peroxin-domain-containing protein [Neohortaea acidophila]
MAGSSNEVSASIANREEPIPIIRLPSRDDDFTTSSDTELERSRKDKVKSQARTAQDAYAGSAMRQSIQDRFFENLLAKVLPAEEGGEQDGANKKKDKKPSADKPLVERPNFSLGVMNNNFRRFNARIGIAFVVQNKMIQLFTWHDPIATLSFLAVYTILCLEPYLLPLVPLVGLLFAIMTPSFLARHPIPKNDPRIEPSFRGPASAPASRVKPAPELSKDFFRNMRDLQNCMEDFSRIHDAANDWITPYTNFSDEKLSSELYAFTFVFTCAAFLGSQLVPWRFVALAAGWAALLLCHPSSQAVLLSSRTLSQLLAQLDAAHAKLTAWTDSDIILDEPPERREVEIFELQKYHLPTDTWEAWLFSPNAYDPLSPLRIAGARAKGTQFFEDVQAPGGWVWRDKKWTLDLASREWVEQRMITGVEIETEGERWVYDLPEVAVNSLGAAAAGATPAKAGAKKSARVVPRSGWEESNGFGERGEWRRRRWFRVVERKRVGKAVTINKPE